MATMNPNLILQASQGIDVLGALGRGNALAREQMDMQRQRQEDAWRQDERQYRRDRDAQTDARTAKLDERADQEWSMKVDEYMASKSAAEREQEAKEVERVLAGARHFYDKGDRSGFDGWLANNGLDPAQYAFDDFPAHAEFYEGIAKRMRGGKVGLNPIYGVNAQGDPVLMQLDDAGNAVQTVMPEGVSIDLGLQAEERAAGSARGKGRGEAELSLPAAYVEAEHVIGLVDDLMNDPYLKNMVGPINSRLPNTSSDAARVQSRMDQVSGQGFMAARSFLKGQGQITDFESRRAEAAMSRMNAAQSYEDYVAALEEFQDAVRVGLMKVEAAARSGQLAESTPAPAAPPASSTSGQPARRRWSPDGGLQ